MFDFLLWPCASCFWAVGHLDGQSEAGDGSAPSRCLARALATVAHLTRSRGPVSGGSADRPRRWQRRDLCSPPGRADSLGVGGGKCFPVPATKGSRRLASRGIQKAECRETPSHWAENDKCGSRAINTPSREKTDGEKSLAVTESPQLSITRLKMIAKVKAGDE